MIFRGKFAEIRNGKLFRSIQILRSPHIRLIYMEFDFFFIEHVIKTMVMYGLELCVRTFQI